MDRQGSPTITINVNLADLLGLEKELLPKAKKALEEAARDVATQAHARILENAQAKLHSTREKYIGALGFEQVSPSTWVISLDKSAMWIEEGLCVLYGGSLTPNVLTPEGPVSIKEIKVGSVVLNSDGKWTRVLAVHDNHLFDFCLEALDEEETVRAYGRSSSSLWPRSHKPVVVRCPNCKGTRAVSKFNFSRLGYTVCPKCSKEKKLVKIHISRGQGHNLWVTADHQVLTTKGWVEAGNLTNDNYLLAPAWGECKGCGQKVIWGGEWCAPGCATRQSNFRRLAAGTHPCQDPLWMANVYKKKIAQSGRVSGAEEGEIEMIPVKIKVKTVVPSNGFSLDRRWDVTVEEGSSFVCQGVVVHNSEHEMIDDLLKSPKAKTAKDGSRYVVVPFQHNKGPTSSTPAQQTLTQTVKEELKRRRIPYAKIENGKDGQPKTGLLHSFDILHAPPRTAAMGPGQGWGPIGFAKQGPTGIPFLQGIRVYQRQIKDSATGKNKTVRQVMTFRIASSKMKGTGRWVHPGLDAKNFFDKAADAASREWTSKIAPMILAKFRDSL